VKNRWIIGLGILSLFLLATLSAFAQLPGGIPREETLIAAQLTGRVGTPSNFNEWSGWRWQDRGTQQLVHEPLWTVDYASGEIIPGLAAEMPIYNEDFTQMTIKLRQGISWNDGVPFTADDVIFTIELNARTPGLLYHGPMAEFVKGVSKVDDYTVVVELKKPNSRFHTDFLDRWGCLRIMPKHVFEKVEDPVTFEFNPPVGCGPYKLADYDPAGFWTLWERRSDWEKSPTGMLYGEPKPKYVLVQVFETEVAKIIAQLRHELDATDYTIEALRAVLDRGETVRAWSREWPWVEYLHPCITGIVFNNMVAPYNLREVRWALLLAIDIVEYMSIANDLIGAVSPIHLPWVRTYMEPLFSPMEEWLKEFTIDLGDGEVFRPYDPEVPFRLAQAAKKRGYPVPEDPAKIRELFGMGWWKYAPEVAEKLLVKNGFKRGADGRWLLPDGTLWKINILTFVNPSHPPYRNAMALAEVWRKFGIDCTTTSSEAAESMHLLGQFEVGTSWPAREPWGVSMDLYRTFSLWHSRLLTPVGQPVVAGSGASARWSNPELDAIVEKMELLNPFVDVEELRQLNIEALKIVAQEMPTIPTFTYPSALAWDEYYWTNWPGAENPYSQPYHHWPNFKYMLPRLQSRK